MEMNWGFDWGPDESELNMVSLGSVETEALGTKRSNYFCLLDASCRLLGGGCEARLQADVAGCVYCFGMNPADSL